MQTCDNDSNSGTGSRRCAHLVVVAAGDESGVLDDADVVVVVVVVVVVDVVAVGVAVVAVDIVGVGEAGRNLEPKPLHALLKGRSAFATRHGVRDRRLLVDVLLESAARERGGVTVCYKVAKSARRCCKGRKFYVPDPSKIFRAASWPLSASSPQTPSSTHRLASSRLADAEL